MKSWTVILWLLLAGGIASQPALAQETAPAAGARFLVMDVWVDSGTEALAAYQVEIAARGAGSDAAGTNRPVRIVGVEGGEAAAFRSAPYYDPAAMQQERVVLGAFSLLAPD